MANVHLSDRAEYLYAKRQKASDKCFLTHHVIRYTDTTEPAQFSKYFYPWELLLVQSNNYENYEGRTKRADFFFDNKDDLKAFENDLTYSSSNDEDRPPGSEELFFDQQDDNVFDDLAESTGYVPPLTQMQRDLLSTIARYVFDSGDNMGMIAFKREKRLILLRGYIKDLKRKRYARAYRRYRNTRERKLDLGREALDLLELEILDKHLNRSHYYNQNEPSEYKKLLSIRRNAIKAKFMQYLTDPKFRRAYRDRIYYNVNMDVPDDDTLHMQSIKLLLADANRALNPYAVVDVSSMNDSNVSSWTQQRKGAPDESIVEMSALTDSIGASVWHESASVSRQLGNMTGFVAGMKTTSSPSPSIDSNLETSVSEKISKEKTYFADMSAIVPLDTLSTKMASTQPTFESMKEQMSRQTPEQKTADDAAFNKRVAGLLVKSNTTNTTEPNRLPPLMVQPGLLTWAIRKVVRKVEVVSRMQLDESEKTKTKNSMDVLISEKRNSEIQKNDKQNENSGKFADIKSSLEVGDVKKDSSIVNSDDADISSSVAGQPKAQSSNIFETDLMKREEEIRQKETAIQIRETDLNKRETKLNEMEAAIKERENEIKKREADILPVA